MVQPLVQLVTVTTSFHLMDLVLEHQLKFVESMLIIIFPQKLRVISDTVFTYSLPDVHQT